MNTLIGFSAGLLLGAAIGVLADAALRRCYLNGQPLVTPLREVGAW